MSSVRKEQICALLKGIETGDPAAVAVVDQEEYIQHNPQTHEGSEGLAALFKRLSKTSPRVNIIVPSCHRKSIRLAPLRAYRPSSVSENSNAAGSALSPSRKDRYPAQTEPFW